MDKAINKGVFITIEGADGAGKTTHIEYLKRWLVNKKMDVIATREPGGTRLGESLRKILLDDDAQSNKQSTRISDDTELMLMFAARMQHLHEVILPALAAGRYVLCDRFTDSTYAYQGGGRGISEQRIQQLEHWVQNGLQPDLTLMLDVPLDVGLARTQKRGTQGDRFEQQQIDSRREAQSSRRIKLRDASKSKCGKQSDLIELVRTQKRGTQGDRFEQQQIDFKQAVRQTYLRRAAQFPQRIKLLDASKSMSEVQTDLIQSVESFLMVANRGINQ